MTDIKYDPELPYAVIIREDHKEDTILGRFPSFDYAEQFVKAGTMLREIVDTTPKPKIPEGAEYIIWERDGETTMAFADGGDWYGNSEYWTHEQILEEIGDAEVTVLVRKEAQ